VLHNPTEVSLGCFDQNVVMIGHQTVGMNDPVELLTHFFECL